MERTGIAVVGMSCRLPGGPDLAGFWNLLDEGRDATGQLPPARYSLADAGPIARRRGLGAGGFLDRIEDFDPAFFGLSAAEACRLDPQQRLLLEASWEALEDAGVAVERVADRTGVYIGCLTAGYRELLGAAGITDLHADAGSGILGSPAGRISYALDLRGSSMMVDSKCSTSLLAVHLAAAGLRAGETDLALVGAASLLLGTTDAETLAQAGLLTAAGACRFGDAEADGYVRSEGVAMIALRRLSDALADGDRVYAVIEGSAVTNDGRSGGSLFAPGRASQEEMLRRAYADAGVTAADIDYVEAHGPGTPVGDEVELNALATVQREAGRSADAPCLVGSVKSNLGHTEAAAGLVGLVKIALALRHGTLPPTLHVRSPNSVLDGSPLRLATQRQPWPRQPGRRRLAGVSSFGISGTNVHVVLGEAPEAPEAPEAADATAPAATATPAAPKRRRTQKSATAGGYLLPLSARSPQALRELAAGYAELLSGPYAPRALDACYSAGLRRTHHQWRAAAVGADREELVAALRDIAAGTGRHAGALVGTAPAHHRPRVAFVFPGQGWQTPTMGRNLLRADPAFGKAVGECDKAIRAEAGWSVRDRLTGAVPLSGVATIQPTMWAVAVGMAASWRALGIAPDLVLGHSMGEVAAATVSGALTVADAAAVMCRRSRLLGTVEGHGAMAYVQLGQHEALRLAHEYAGTEDAAGTERVTLAAANSGHATVLAGDRDVLTGLVEELTGRGVFAKLLRVEVAGHGPHVEPVGDPLRAELRDLRPRVAGLPMYSTVPGSRTGRQVTGTELDAQYWVDNLRLPVLFAEAVDAALAGDEPTVFIELSAQPQLLEAIRDCAGERAGDGMTNVRTVASFHRDSDFEPAALRRAVAQAYLAGCAPDWAALAPGGRFVELPRYRWQRQRYWLDNAADVPAPLPELRPELLPATPGVPPAVPAVLAPGFGAEPAAPAYGADPLASLLVADCELTADTAPYLADAAAAGAPVPAGSYLAAVLGAVGGRTDGTPAGEIGGSVLVRDFERGEPLPPQPDGRMVLRVLLREADGGTARSFEVHGRRSARGALSTWAVVARGVLAATGPQEQPRPVPVEMVRAWCEEFSTGADFYRELAPGAGPRSMRLRALGEVWSRPGEALALLDYPARYRDELAGHRLHPALLEACGQALAATLPAPLRAGRGLVTVAGVDEIRCRPGPAQPVWVHARLTGTDGEVCGEVTLLGRDGTVLAELCGLWLAARPDQQPGHEPRRYERPVVNLPLVDLPAVSAVSLPAPNLSPSLRQPSLVTMWHDSPGFGVPVQLDEPNRAMPSLAAAVTVPPPGRTRTEAAGRRAGRVAERTLAERAAAERLRALRAVQATPTGWPSTCFWPDAGTREDPAPAATTLTAAPAAPAPPPPAPPPAAPAQADPAADLARLVGYLTERVAELLQEAPDALDTAVPLTALGLDSLYAARLRLRLEQDLAVSLPIRDFLRGGTLADVAGALLAATKASRNGAQTRRP